MPEKFEFRYLPVTKSDIDREIYVTCLGRLRYEPGAAYPCAGHPQDHNFDWAHGRDLGDFAVILIEKGRGDFEDRSLGRVRWNDGEVLLLPSGVWHRYRPLRSMGWTETWFGVNGALLHRWRTKGLFPSTPLIRKLREPAVFCASHAALQAASAQGNSVQLSACAMTCLGVALEGLELGHRGDLPTLTGDELVDRSIGFILLNCHRPLTVAGVAAAVHTTRRTLERAYARVHERSVGEEIAWHRVERARLMLMEGNMSVKEIGYASGFGGAKRLFATFRRLKQPLLRSSDQVSDRR